MSDESVFSWLAKATQNVYQSAKAVLDLKVDTEVAIRINDITGQLGNLMSKFIEAQSAHMECQNRATELQKEVDRLKAFNLEKQRYKMIKVDDCAFTYELREDCANGEPIHQICAHCYNNGLKGILSFSTFDGAFKVIACSQCKNEIRIKHYDITDSVQTARISSQWDAF